MPKAKTKKVKRKPVEPRPTQGARLLLQWMSDNGKKSQKWVGNQLTVRGEPVHQTNISAWIIGRAIPIEAAVALRALTGIPVEAWAVEEKPKPVSVSRVA